MNNCTKNNPSVPFYRPFLSAVIAIALLTGCSAQTVKSAVIKPIDSPVERLVIVIQNGTFNGPDVAANSANRNLSNLIPHLESQLPLVFAANGVETRTLRSDQYEKQMPVPKADNEALMLIKPVSATFSTRSGEQMKFMALLIPPKSALPVWQGNINLSTPGYGNAAAMVSNKIGRDLVHQLVEDKMIRLPDEEIHKVTNSADSH